MRKQCIPGRLSQRLEIEAKSLLASISGRLKTLIFQWATIEAREWLHLPLVRTRHPIDTSKTVSNYYLENACHKWCNLIGY